MPRFVGWIAISLLVLTVLSAHAQDATKPAQHAPTAKPAGQAASPNPPDMVCFGEDPKWSIQFVSWGARYIGINEPDRNFRGGYVWVPEEKVWAWQQKNKFGMPTGGHELSAVMRKESCTDPTHKGTFSYSAEVTLPEGDIVSGCCRKLQPGEAPAEPLEGRFK